ncbi:hypothetical protein [Qipengyuania atrilutea]|uniref:Lipoprotein n=1 Tax=Qipengyuania atrilutea TaxID=2744473 RepID=A0A850GYR2_9SPHN|nr:hypothetical protein [Actirhodobacter atriluteus]NVD44784.1 hypothetical protein [Actirhodobacter atriluteus]
MGSRTILAASTAAMLLSACTQQGDETAEGEETAAVETAPTTAADVASGDSAPAPEPLNEFSGTAWRAIGEDGARFTTYLDADGTYRDLRNGDFYQTGGWNFDGEEICFTPENESDRGDCWSPGVLRDDTVTMSRGDDFNIELEKVEYTPPDEDTEAHEEAGGEEN